MEPLAIYNNLRAVPEEAQKKITAGRLNGFTDINSMWRIKKDYRNIWPLWNWMENRK